MAPIGRTLALVLIAFLATALAGDGARAEEHEDERLEQLEERLEDLTDEVEELKREKAEREARGEAAGDDRVGAVAREVDRLKRALAVPEDEELRSVYGLGPGASKVYLRERGLSIGGYGEANVRFLVDNKGARDNVADAERFVAYLGYKFNDWIVLNSEIEFEHSGTSGGGSASVEFLTLDFLLSDAVNVRTGLVLPPMGLVNEIHEPLFFYGVARPEAEQLIIPSTWREIGAGLFGSLFDDRVQYRVYAINSFDATGFTSSGLRGGRQKGSRAKADDWAGVARVDVTPLDGVQLGASVFSGATGQTQMFNGMAVPDVWTTIYEVHGIYTGHGLTVRGLWTQAFVNEAGALSRVLGVPGNAAVSSRHDGGYVTVAYDVLPCFFPDTEMSLEPFFRYEYVDTQASVPDGFTRDRSKQFHLMVPGLQFKPHPQVVLKVDYRNFDPLDGRRADEVQIGLGFVF